MGHESLTWLRLSSNQLSSLPDAVGTLVNLKKLSLYDNQLSSLPGAVDAWFEGLEQRGCLVYL